MRDGEVAAAVALNEAGYCSSVMIEIIRGSALVFFIGARHKRISPMMTSRIAPVCLSQIRQSPAYDMQ